jgi:hypothetical protein
LAQGPTGGSAHPVASLVAALDEARGLAPRTGSVRGARRWPWGTPRPIISANDVPDAHRAVAPGHAQMFAALKPALAEIVGLAVRC